jgi:hypothetical protein
MTKGIIRLFCLAGLAALPRPSPGAGAQTFTPPTQAPWGKRADNMIWAQKVLNDIMAGAPDLAALGLHAVPPGVPALPGDPGQVVIAQVDDLIGKPDSPGDLEVAKKEMTKIFYAPLSGVMRLRVLAPLHDARGRTIGLAIFSFRTGPKVTPLSAHARATALLARMARQFPDQASLFRPVAPHG